MYDYKYPLLPSVYHPSPLYIGLIYTGNSAYGYFNIKLTLTNNEIITQPNS